MNLRKTVLVVTVPLLSFALAACTGPADDLDAVVDKLDDAANDAAADGEVGNDGDGGDLPGPTYADVTAIYSTCEAVQPLVATFVDGLVLGEETGLTEWSLHCEWVIPEGATDMSLNRTLTVMVQEGSGTVLTADELESSSALQAVEHPAIEDLGGIVFAMAADTSVATSVSVTTQLPAVEILIGGAGWADTNHLTAEDAAGVAAQLLGVG
ncbi:hypothetical protein LEP48_11375 [Isoptericola sp. NEAU-Y5]|uniref:Lipoprotein n=1 Tax=Isoptericola luteus TaxID=2879484 RepID=A0ABS7ZG02_9MICO|nr:hypothetical protein [Isoptericola sp. NEAU-Y5]MCA5893950.1 hypothetical protein [Isoptericola sp. NEAU-Y5]